MVKQYYISQLESSQIEYVRKELLTYSMFLIESELQYFLFSCTRTHKTLLSYYKAHYVGEPAESPHLR